MPWLAVPVAAADADADAGNRHETGTLALTAVPHPLVADLRHGQVEIDGQGLRIAADKGTDLFVKADGSAAADTLPRALFHAEGDFILSVQVRPVFGGGAYEGAALVVHAGERCWGKLLFERFACGSNGIATTVANGKGGDDAYHGTRADADQYLKIVHRRGGWIFYASPDGRTWEFLRQFALDCGGPAKVGFAAQAPLSEGFEATFERVRYRAGTITDFWQGE